MPVTIPGRAPPRKYKLPPVVRPAVNHRITKEIMEKNAFQLKVRLDRNRSEQSAMYRREYNMIAGRLTHTGATAAVIRDTAIRNFVATHGQHHLPR
jgi:hypothetical protein